ncbi:hypothetical protein L3Q82_003180 [Scortum barcoo]|uniref:Uncharacterized protein n=1 Tax=Scortum barcoo TaxID=214431 RepID=A0ACB8VRT7_9TELE|nr:hypothetical protein L3Q82_003180 [Scortum barcoo]
MRDSSVRFVPQWLKKYLTFGKSSLLRTDLPSVSLLQKSPSSPVSCHATGFYPDRATLIWRKDGEELHEDVDHGEILPNHDGSFQMSVDLKLSSVTPEDWSRYDCVFHLSGVKDDIVTKLDKAEIRTNWVVETKCESSVLVPDSPSESPAAAVIGVVVGLLLLALCIAGLFIWKRNNKDLPSVSLLQKSPSSPVSCHATGFYPDRATLIWRKDGEELHEDVDHGEILPNHDGSFQMSVDLKLSSVTPEDWSRYDCVFHLSGVKDDIVTKLDKAEIRTNWGEIGIRSDEEEPSNITVLITAAVVVLALIIIIIAVIGFIFYKKKKAHRPPPLKHSLKFSLTGSTGLPNFPEFVGTVMVDDTLAGYCDSNRKMVEPKQDWMKEFLENDPQQLELYTQHCSETGPNSLKARISSVKQSLNHTGGVHILQWMGGCEWDNETGDFYGFLQYGYDGEDFISFDLKTLTWIASKPQAVTTKLSWDADKARIKRNENYLTQIYPEWLKKFLTFGKSSLLRTDLPSVSLLQKSPSSPVSCHATGFYPDRATLIWRKDGEELHEDVDHGEILPNHDGSFQMSVDLKLSSVTPEDWSRYDCVFHLSGVKDDIVTKLDKAEIRTNWEKPSNMIIPIIAAVAVLAVILMAAAGFILYKKRKGIKKAKSPPHAPDNSSELSERLNPET